MKYGELDIYAYLIKDEERFYQFMKGLGLDLKPLKEKGLFQYIVIPTLFEPGVSESISEILDIVESTNTKRLMINFFTAKDKCLGNLQKLEFFPILSSQE